MKANINQYKTTRISTRPQDVGLTNFCQCGAHEPIYRRSACGGFTISCPECGARVDRCVENLGLKNSNLLRMDWNSMTLDSLLSQRFIDGLGAEEGSLLIVRGADSAIIGTYDDMDDALEFIKRECKRNFTIDYSICQIKEKCEDEYIICHLATSKLLAYVGGFEGFDWGKMSTVDK